MMVADIRRKELALGRIKRLASSGLSLEPFGRAVLDLIHDGVPHSPNRVILAGGSNRVDACIGSTYEIAAAVPLYHQYFVDAPPGVSGVKYQYNSYALRWVLPSRIIWPQEELTLPNFLQAEAFNTVYRPLGWHHFVQIVFQEGGDFLGYSPIWRSSDQKPFSRDDIAFLRASASHISHGLKTAQLGARRNTTVIDSFAPFSGWGSGAILMDRSGNLIALDSVAELIFQQIGVFDDLASKTFSHPIREALEYISRMIASIFHESELSRFRLKCRSAKSMFTGPVSFSGFAACC